MNLIHFHGDNLDKVVKIFILAGVHTLKVTCNAVMILQLLRYEQISMNKRKKKTEK